MSSSLAPVGERVRFEEFELDLHRRELSRSDRVLKLERIPMELLLLLVEERNSVVTRERIAERVWGKVVFHDTDNSINGAIRKIRQVLKDNPEQPRFVQTVTGKGYRFIGSLRDNPAPRKVALSPAEVTAGLSSPIVELPRKRWAVLLIAAFFLTVVLGIGWRWFRPRTQIAAPDARLMLAVLPFENLTGDPAEDYFSDGLTEEMITQVGRLDPRHLGVIGRTSVMHYKKTQEQLEQIGRELGVQYVLEGSVRRDSSKLRISAHLLQLKDQSDLWSREYDRELSSLLSLQEEIAQEVTDEIDLTLRHNRVATRNAHAAVLSPAAYDAYDLYLKGRYFWNKRTPAGFLQAIACFQQAIKKNPAEARAYAGLADSYAMMSGYNLASPLEAMPKAREAALKGLQIDESLAEAHTSLALISQNYDWDWQTAEKEYRRAIQLDPNYATAHHWYAESLAFQGRFTEAEVESERAQQLEPLSVIIRADSAAIFYFSRQYDHAIDRFREVLDMDPSSGRALLIVSAYAQKRQFKDALAEIQNWRRIDNGPWTWAWEAYVYGCAGEAAKAKHALRQVQKAHQGSSADSASMLAVAYLGMNDKDRAIASLQEAYRNHANAPTAFKVDPIYDPLRNDPRFQDLLHRVGLAQ